MQETQPIDATRCPLCGQRNQCAGQLERVTGVKQPPCWCNQATFGAELLSRVPEHARRQACICAACAQAGGLLVLESFVSCDHTGKNGIK